jgi:hypothetical protein
MRFEPLEDDRQAVWLLLHVPPPEGEGTVVDRDDNFR